MATSFRLGTATLQTGWDCDHSDLAFGTMKGDATSHCDRRADPVHRSSSALREVKQEEAAKVCQPRDPSHPRLSRGRLAHRGSGPTALFLVEETVLLAVSTYHRPHRGGGHGDEAKRIDPDDGSKARGAIGNDPDRPAVSATDLEMLAVAGFVLDWQEASADCSVAAVSSSEVVWWRRCHWLVSLLAWLAMKLRMGWLRLWRPFCEFRVGCFGHSTAGRCPGQPYLSPCLSLSLSSCSFLGLEHRLGHLQPRLMLTPLLNLLTPLLLLSRLCCFLCREAALLLQQVASGRALYRHCAMLVLCCDLCWWLLSRQLVR